MIEVVATPPLNTVQDLGRRGQRHIGVGTCGAMDALALETGNCMVGNAGDAAGIEVQTFPLELRFLDACRFAVTGADCAASLAGRAVLPWWNRQAKAGEVLRLEHPPQGARVYLAVEGGIDVPQVLGSRSTDIRSAFGGVEGRFLRRGDRLPLGPAASNGRSAFGIVPPALERVGDAIRVRVLRAGEYERFPPAMQQVFWESDWQVTHQSDRAGYRLSGPQLLPDSHIEMRSYGVVPGLVQVPPGGQPIVQLSDANSAGGYPKIAAVIEADLWRLGQARPGAKVRFVDCAYREALQAQRQLDTWRARVCDAIAACHPGLDPGSMVANRPTTMDCGSRPQ